MKLCTMSYTFARRPESFSLRGMLEFTQALGLQAIEFVTLHDTDAQTLRTMAQDLGISVSCYTFLADLNFADRRARRSGVDDVRRGVEAALVLGTDTVMLPIPGKPGITREQSRANVLEGLREAVASASESGVTLTVENFPSATSPFVVADDVLAAISDVPGLALTFDNGNVLTGGEDPAVAFARCAEHVVHAHFKDWKPVGEEYGLSGLDGRRYSAALIGEGIVDQKSCLAAMQKAGYKGYISLEYEGDEYTPAEATRRAVAYLRELMGDAKGEA